MSSETTTETDPSTETEPPEGVEPESTPEAERERDESGRLLSREAANYRRQLRDAQTERDQLREQLDQRDRVEAERLAAANGLAVPADLWLHGATVDTLRGEGGAIDPEIVTGLVGDLIRDRPGLRAPRNGDLGGGKGAGATSQERTRTPGLSALLKPGQG